MSQPPDANDPSDRPDEEPPTTPYQSGGQPTGGEPPSHDQPGYPPPGQQPPGYDQGYGYPPGNQQPGYQQGYEQGYGYQPGYPPGYQPYGYPTAPYGIHPQTGIPYSDKSKIVAGLLQVLLPLGIGRMYMGHTGIGVAQLLVTIFTCGIGAVWPFVDGIIILVNDTTDADGRMLRS